MTKKSKEVMPGIGWIKAGQDVFTYQIGESSSEYRKIFNDSVAPSTDPLSGLVWFQNINGYNVYPAGINNLEPNEQKEIISKNRLLPEVIEKQVKMLYGDGPALYKRMYQGEKVSKQYLDVPEVQKWLESWLENGLQDSYLIYLNKCIRSYYYDEGIFSKWRLTSDFANKRVAGLEHISTLRARFATKENVTNRTDFVESDFPYILVGNWAQIQNEFKVYPVIDWTNPLITTSAMSYSKNPSHGEEIYAYNKFYRGIKDWLIGSNLTPHYINSFLENSLSARLHIIIPKEWVEDKEEILRKLCSTNVDRLNAHQELLRVKFGENDYMDVGTEYHEGLVSEYVARELRKLTDCLSGAGKNQGKIFASYSFTNSDGHEIRWKIEPIENKSKEYIDALTSYDKRADEVITSSKGVDSSVSNISKDGIISKSGADVFYNYLIYLKGLTIPEEVICRDINMAIKINFPAHFTQGIRLGFYRSGAQKQEDQNPEDRLSNSQM